MADWLRGWVMTGYPGSGWLHPDRWPLQGFAPIPRVQGITALLLTASALWLLWQTCKPAWLLVPVALVGAAQG